MSSETLTTCPFCKNMTIKILHIPFVANTFTSKCRAGGRNTVYQREKFNILSGCEVCDKTQKEVQDELDGKKEIPHEERLRRIRESGLPTNIEESRFGHSDE